VIELEKDQKTKRTSMSDQEDIGCMGREKMKLLLELK
jgi:hypothetical protein